jgi:hypothetical protein
LKVRQPAIVTVGCSLVQLHIAPEVS